MKIATWNVNSLRVRLGHLERWLTLAEPDVVCLQETKLVDAEFPKDEIHRFGYEHVCFWGEQTYNGVAILSRWPLEDVRLGMDDEEEDAQARIAAATVKGVRIYNCYVPNGQAVGSPKFAYKLRWLERLHAWIARVHTPADRVLVCGDMNIAPDDLDTWDPFRTEGQLLCHPEERARLQAMLDWGLFDAFRELHPFASEFSWWDYRRMGFERNHGLRIDHIFVTRPLMDRARDVTLFREVRGWEQPSDHIPVQIDLDLA